VESLLSDAEGSSIHTRVAVRKSYNFLSERWITVKFYRSFQTLCFLGVDVESLLGEEEVSSLETSVPVRKGHNF